MSTITLTPIDLAVGVASVDLLGAEADDQNVTTSDTFRIPINGSSPRFQGETRLVLFIEELGGGASTLTVDAGDYPPAMLASKGALTVAMLTSDLKLLVLEPGRHEQNDGYITGSVATNTLAMTAYRIPVGH